MLFVHVYNNVMYDVGYPTHGFQTCTKFSCAFVAPEVITCYPNEAETISFIGDCLSAKCSMVIVGDVCTYYILLLLTCLWYRCSDSKLVGTFG